MSNEKKKKKEQSLGHQLIPEHILLTGEEVQKILKRFDISADELPRIKKKDPALAIFDIKAKAGDVIKIKRKEETGSHDYFRVVIDR